MSCASTFKFSQITMKNFYTTNTVHQICEQEKCHFLVYIIKQSNEIQQDAQLSQRDHAAGCVIGFAKSRRLGRQYFTDIIGLSSTTVI